MYDTITPEWLSDRQVAAIFSVSRSTVWRWAHDGHLPRPRKIGPQCVRWRRVDIERVSRELAGEAA